MTEPHYTETTTTTSNVPPQQQPTTTIIERRSGGSGMIIALALLIAVAAGAYFLFNQSKNEAVKTDAISSAAKSVGDTADKAGEAIEEATK